MVLDDRYNIRNVLTCTFIAMGGHSFRLTSMDTISLVRRGFNLSSAKDTSRIRHLEQVARR
jgi:hypothetical protein